VIKGVAVIAVWRNIRPPVTLKIRENLMIDLRLCAATLLAAIVFTATTGHALAQQSTSATYDDWVLRCVTQGTPPQKVCNMEQLTQVQGKNTPLSRVAIARPMKAPPVKLVIQLPVNIWLPAGIKIQMNDKDPGFVGLFTYCTPAGCFAEVDASDDTLKKFRAAVEPARIVFKNAGQQDVAIPLSFKGFGQAYDALLKG
jgi:invasion protein IalB